MTRSNITLSEDQKKFIDENISKITDLIEMTRSVFMDDTLDGRTKEGRAVRAYLIERGQKFSTTKAAPAKNIKLSQEQKEFIQQYAADGVKAFQIAKIIFPDSELTPLSKETIVITEYIRDSMPQVISEEDSARGVEYNPPCTDVSAIKKVNECTGLRLVKEKLTRSEMISIEFMQAILKSPRFVYQINSYTDLRDRELFEAEFVRACWDKPDLTPDEINLYINVCMDYINLKQIEKINMQ